MLESASGGKSKQVTNSARAWTELAGDQAIDQRQGQVGLDKP